MESKIRNWNNKLNRFIVSVGLIVVTMLFGLLFFIPTTPKAKAMTKEDLQSENIYFVSAKTKLINSWTP